ncbi:Cytochrome b5 domain-containing protein 1 [Entophlyctis sp. JEL0112]|nr:Cytochrome b5 domain-containing protein 1 [Entophlyctis sp. JEL0112]
MTKSAATTPRTKTPPDAKRYYTPAEVEQHNAAYDLWLSWHGHVYDLSVLADEHKGDPLLTPILKNAGRDISHWFNKNGDVRNWEFFPPTKFCVLIKGNRQLVKKQLKTCVNPLTGVSCAYTPEENVRTPWWLDKEQYCIGKLGSRTRKLLIKNTLTQDEHVLEVCVEETVAAIQDRYLAQNAHAKGYMWKRLGTLLDMGSTLEENGVKDESALMQRLGMDEEQYLPTIHLYFR